MGAQKGCIPWNKGLTKETDERVARVAKAKIGMPRLDMVGDKNPMKRPKVQIKHKEAVRKRSQTQEWLDKMRKSYTPERNAKIQAALVGRTYKDIFGVEGAEKRKQKTSGENSPLWKGGPKDYHPNFTEEFRNYIRNRDDNICQACGKTEEEEGRKLSVHHIEHDKMNDCSDEFDFITVCKKCNMKAEGKNALYYERYFIRRNLAFERFSPLVNVV